jgi:hypothetical protein
MFDLRNHHSGHDFGHAEPPIFVVLIAASTIFLNPCAHSADTEVG